MEWAGARGGAFSGAGGGSNNGIPHLRMMKRKKHLAEDHLLNMYPGIDIVYNFGTDETRLRIQPVGKRGLPA